LPDGCHGAGASAARKMPILALHGNLSCGLVEIHMEVKITKRTVDQLKADKRDTILWDSELKRFGVRCRQSGAKHYMLKMRVGGRQRWLTIGRHCETIFSVRYVSNYAVNHGVGTGNKRFLG
jgi:hypothetical protein